MKSDQKPSKNQIDGDRLNKELTDWYYINLDRSKAGLSPLKAPDYAGEVILKIIKIILHTPSMIRYTDDWKDSMTSSGILSGTKALSKFNPMVESVNAMSLIWAYVMRGILNGLHLEQRELKIREDLIKNSDLESVGNHCCNDFDDPDEVDKLLSNSLSITRIKSETV